MRFFLIILLLSGFLSLQASGRVAADEASHRKATAEMLNLINMDDLLSKALDQMLQLQIQQNPQLEPYKDTMRKFLSKYLGWASLKDEVTRFYMEAFTEQEIKEITAFYKTPTGQKTLQKMPELTAKGAQLGAKRVQDNIGELQAMLEEEMTKQEELKKETGN